MEVDRGSSLSETKEEESSSKRLSQLNDENTLYAPPESFADSPKNPEDYEVISGLNLGEAQDVVNTRDTSVINVPRVERNQGPTNYQISERTPLIPNIIEDSYRTIYVRSGTWNEQPDPLCDDVRCCIAIRRFSRVFSTPISLPFYFVTMCFPVIAGYISAVHIDGCPIFQHLPMLFLIMAICAVVCITCRILEIMCNWFFSGCPHGLLFCLYFIHILTFGTMMLMLTTGFIGVWSIDPDLTDARSRHYCDPLFYNFWYYGTLGSFISIILLCIFFPGSICFGCGCFGPMCRDVCYFCRHCPRA